jgi:hypothetical protein
MAAFVSSRQSIPNATATKIVDADDFDRRVYVNGTGTIFRVAFTSATASTGAALGSLAGSNEPAVFVLPADEELWVYQNTGNPADVDFLVTLAK